jgi:hypothetical protein
MGAICRRSILPRVCIPEVALVDQWETWMNVEKVLSQELIKRRLNWDPEAILSL